MQPIKTDSLSLVFPKQALIKPSKPAQIVKVCYKAAFFSNLYSKRLQV
jgi:hypothetical protein